MQEPLAAEGAEVLAPTLSQLGSAKRRQMRRKSVTTISPVGSATIKAVAASTMLRGFGRAFRTLHLDSQSAVVPGIHEFWSYSRHGNLGEHVCSLLLFYNALPALVFGCLAVAVSLLLMRSELLPTSVTRSPTLYITLYIVVVATHAAVLLSWKSSRKVFVDSACIDQTDRSRKTDGILSIGHFLKMSDRLLILWDGSYFTRLWCVFEIATYLKLQADGAKTKPVMVLPGAQGAVSLSVHVGCAVALFTTLPMILDPADLALTVVCRSLGVCAGIFAVERPMRRHLRIVKEMHAQLQNFSLRKAECFCCSVGHIDPKTNDSIDCDRVLIESCVVQWFGQVETFDSFARRELEKHMDVQPHLPLHCLYCCATPFLASAALSFVWLEQAGRPQEAWIKALDEFMNWALLLPIAAKVIFKAQAPMLHRSDTLSHLAMNVVATLAYAVAAAVFSYAPYLLGLYGYLARVVFLGGYIYLAHQRARSSFRWPLKPLVEWLC